MYAVIDMGSNTIRLSVYQLNGKQMKLYLHEKRTVGLAGYIHDGILSEEGILRACNTLEEFRSLLSPLPIRKTMVLAGSSLRNAVNGQIAASQIEQKTGYPIHMISGREEASLGFRGAFSQTLLVDGMMADIGGGSTKLVIFSNGSITESITIPLGSLNLHKDYIKGILPKPEELDALHSIVHHALREAVMHTVSISSPAKTLLGVGGTIRAIGSLYCHAYGTSNDDRTMEAHKLDTLYTHLTASHTANWQMILKLCPDRIHTLIPGFTILRIILEQYQLQTVEISPWGLREGYLLQYLSQIR